MKDVRVRKVDLLEKLRGNMAKHRGFFLKAQEGFRREVIGVMERRLEDARCGKKVRLVIQLEEPEDQTSAYNRAITMLEMSTDDIVTVTEIEFREYVMDDWSWKSQFNISNCKYVPELEDEVL